MKIYLGCSGFMYREWKPDFYPNDIPQRKWLEFYSSKFNSLEINSTFYKFPLEKNLKKFYDDTTADFKFSLKVPRLITHYKQLKECRELAQDFYLAVQNGLEDKTGCILYQFPPKFSFTEERLQLLSEILNPLFNNIAEFRNASWYTPEIIAKLGENNITMSGLSHPLLPDLQQPIVHTPLVYYRFHGIPKLFYSAYEETELDDFLTTLKSNKGITELYIYFNNTASLAALHNANYLQEKMNNDFDLK